MNVEDRERFWTALDFLSARARVGEPTLDEVSAFAMEMHAHVRAKPNLWHAQCFNDANGMLRWNATLQRRHPGATTGLTLALSALRMATAPDDAIEAPLREPTDRSGFDNLGKEIAALRVNAP